jgi:hypothetical protein
MVEKKRTARRTNNVLLFVGMSVILLISCMSVYKEAKCQEINQAFHEFPLIDANMNLYRITDIFNLQAFYSGHELRQVRVSSDLYYEKCMQLMGSNKLDYEKCYQRFQNSVLSKEQYDEIIKSVQKLKSLGLETQKGRIGNLSNNVMHLLDLYEYGVIWYAIKYKAFYKEEYGYIRINVIYARAVSGKIEDKNIIDLYSIEKRYRIKINGQWYWTTEIEFNKSKVNDFGTVKFAAPIPDSM